MWMWTRPVAAVCASCIAHIAVFPFDTLKTRALVHTNVTGHVYDGIGVQLSGNIVGTAIFFSVYERCLASDVLVVCSAAIASASSSIPLSAFDMEKKRRQTRRPLALTPRKLFATTMLHASKRIPRACVHYYAYEPLVRIMRQSGVHATIAGAVSAFVGTCLATLFLFPLDSWRTQQLFDEQSTVAQRARSRRLALWQALLSSSIGHAILETLAPRE